MSNKVDYLNCGCGSRFDTSWQNVDFVSDSPYVRQHDLTKGIPYGNNSFDVVYHSHVLEHFPKSLAGYFINECYRVLRPGGILRVAVPDLEGLAKSYLSNLQKATQDSSPLNDANYQWSVIELIDQLLRHKPGGEMKEYWQQQHILNEDFIISRMGFEFIKFRKANELNSPGISHKAKTSPLNILKAIRQKVRAFIIKEDPRYLSVGKFRLSGEVHQWMYDRYSLSSLLDKAGFKNIMVSDAFTSSMPGWQNYRYLDVENEKPRKPDSLFVEAFK